MRNVLSAAALAVPIFCLSQSTPLGRAFAADARTNGAEAADTGVTIGNPR